MEPDELSKSTLYINRELSVLKFNQRVLALAQNKELPLLERLRYLFICSANLDEFFEVRVAGLKSQLVFGRQKTGADGLSVEEVMENISTITHELINSIYDLLNTDLIPVMQANKIYILDADSWTPKQKTWVKKYFKQEILPVISPIGLDLAHPFPRLVNKSLNYIVSLEGKDAFGRDSGLAVVHAPRILPRVIRLPARYCEEGEYYVLLNSIINAYASDLFGGMQVTGCYQFRVTRNSDLLLDEDNIEDLANALKNELFSRRYGTAVRLEIAKDCPNDIAKFLLKKHTLSDNELYRVNGPVNLTRFRTLLDLNNNLHLKFPTFTPGLPDGLAHKHDVFEAIRQSDILLHHPYQSFTPVIDFIRQATIDPDVLAIKLTLYRIEKNSAMANALIDAAHAGKEITAVIELRARFDEERNIEFANRLQEAGALVIYGVVGFKTHAKMMLVVRRENNRLTRYVHIGTGNYHARTAKLYTDFGLFTYNEEVTNDVHEVFQQLTGMGRPSKLSALLQSPFTIYKKMIEFINLEIEQAQAGKKAHIIAKMNSLTESSIIQELYRASCAGVKIDLIIRGICCLRPGIKNISENIRVRSIVGRFLEHSRVYYFYQGGEEKIYCSSADWMERNLFHRVEVCFPILDKQLAKRVKQEALDLALNDNCQAWELQSDGEYKLVTNNKEPLSMQETLLKTHCYQS